MGWVDEKTARDILDNPAKYTKVDCDKPCSECTTKVYIRSSKQVYDNGNSTTNFHAIGFSSCPSGDSKYVVQKNGDGPVEMKLVTQQMAPAGTVTKFAGGYQEVTTATCYCKKKGAN